MIFFFAWLDRHQDAGVLCLRLFVGGRLLYGVLDNILAWEAMLTFRDFLVQFHFPLPLVSAVVSVYAQLVAGICILLGYQIRFAALLMIINFGVALVMVHRHDTFEGLTPALALLVSNILFLFQGAGTFSLDTRWPRKNQ